MMNRLGAWRSGRGHVADMRMALGADMLSGMFSF